MNELKYIEANNKIKRVDENGFYQLEHDQKAIMFYQQKIDLIKMKFNSFEEKIEFLINNNYYINFFDLYNRDQIIDLYTKAYSYEFKFASFMAISKFYESYALKTRDEKNILESYEDRVVCVSMFLARGDIEQAKQYLEVIITQQYQPATPTFLNAGLKDSGELISCFLLDIDDTLNSITYNLSTSMQLSKIGGGVALNLSKLRSRGEEVKGNKGAAKGVMPVMKLLEDSFSYVDQLGRRPGAGAVYLNVFHGDVLEFLDTKKINADEKSRIQTLSLGLVIPDKFMELVKDNKNTHFFSPHNVFEQYGEYLDEMDMNVMYDKLVANPKIIKKVIKARELMQLIAITQFESGYPYLVFIDNANKVHPLKEIGKIKMSNLCTEIFQIQGTSIINDYDEEDQIKYDICCNLGSLNIINVMENKNLEDSVRQAIRALSSVSDVSEIGNAPGIQKGNDAFHAVGLGAMNLHGFLTKQKISYESKLAIEFVDTFFEAMNYYSLVESMNIARQKQETFYKFEKSEYANGNFFEQYLEADSVVSEKVQNLFTGIKLPSKEDWKQLKEDVAVHGLYNAYRLAVAPTQSISYIQNATASIQPIVSQIETRLYGSSTTFFPMPEMTPQNAIYYKSAYNMNQLKIIDLVSAAQKHVDQGISLVLYVTNEVSTKELTRMYYYAWMKNLKSIYYVRTKNLTIEECESCSV